ncbi:phospho-N-acetylmuramoyl-pentapeptide-transferase [Candidatus Aerophobetes bacterium]|nr:phospho-N-acetylmuramoyl-pentapeptide-transferase [Candidatus Aerophobetes bacterium]
MLPNLVFPLTVKVEGAFLLSFFLVILMGKVAVKWLKNKGMVDYFRSDGPSSHYSKKGIPTGGGILVLIALGLTLLIFGKFSNEKVRIALLVTVYLGIVGFWDDWKKSVSQSSRGLRVKFKLLLQIILASLVGIYFYLNFNTKLYIPFFRIYLNINLLYIPLIMAVIVGTCNAVNLTDGLDGLALGCIIPSGGVYAIFSFFAGSFYLSKISRIPYISGAGELGVFWAALLGASCGLLWYNSYPARLFIGDTGSQALGGALGITSILIKQEILLLLVGGVFVLEALSVILQVTSFQLRGKRILKMSPLHHHFELKGIEEPKIVIRFWIASGLLALLGIGALF